MLSLVNHLFQKCPMVYKLVRCMVCLHPTFIALKPEAACSKFRHVLNDLVEAKRLDCVDVDSVREEFHVFVTKVKDLPEFKNFDRKIDKVDVLFFEKCSKDYPKVWGVVKSVLLLSHGQAAAERVFSINKKIIKENQTRESLISLRIVKDHIAHVGGLAKVEVSNELLTYCSSARTRYMHFLEQKKEDEKQVSMEKKRKQCFEETRELKRQCRTIVSEVKTLEENAHGMFLRAEIKKDLSLVSAGNALRTKAQSKKEMLKKNESALAAKELTLSSL